MSKAEVVCGSCGHDYTYRGISCSSSFCPNCGAKIRFDEAHRNGHQVQIIDHFGFKNNTDT